jgi:iron complex transport system substrate-binding protein
VAFIDFFTHPFENAGPSLEILGRLIGREDEADAFVAFRRERLERIAGRLAAHRGLAKPEVFLEVHAGMSDECCSVPGRGNIGNYVAALGGHNIAADLLPGAYGKLNLEQVVAADPAIYIATGGPHLESAGGLVIGISQELSTLVVSPAYKPAVAFAILVVMLVVRPTGLFAGRSS